MKHTVKLETRMLSGTARQTSIVTLSEEEAHAMFKELAGDGGYIMNDKTVDITDKNGKVVEIWHFA